MNYCYRNIPILQRTITNDFTIVLFHYLAFYYPQDTLPKLNICGGVFLQNEFLHISLSIRSIRNFCISSQALTNLQFVIIGR